MNKVKRYIKACHICLKTKNRPVYGWIPVDYAPMQDLSIDIKTMPQTFGRYLSIPKIATIPVNYREYYNLLLARAQMIGRLLLEWRPKQAL